MPSLIDDIRHDIKSDFKAYMKIRMPWWCLLGLFMLAVLSYLLLDTAGRGYLAIPILMSSVVFGFTISVKWRLRTSAWFWIAMSVFAALHVLFILFGPWTSKWVPAPVTAAIAFVDLFVMLAIVDFIARIVKPTSERPRADRTA